MGRVRTGISPKLDLDTTQNAGATYFAEALILVDSQKIPDKFVASTSTVSQGDSNVAMVRVGLWTDEFTAIWKKFMLNRRGNGTDADIKSTPTPKPSLPGTLGGALGGGLSQPP